MARLRSRVAGVAAALVALPLAVAPPAAAAATPDYTITVDPKARGAAIDDSMYGVFFEDINYAADGGLYAELVRNRSFEFLPADNKAYTGLTGWTATAASAGAGTATTVNDAERLNERNRTYLQLALTNPAGGTYGVTNAGYNSGVAVKQGDLYDFSVWARTDATAGTPLTVALQTADGTALATPVRSTSRTTPGPSTPRRCARAPPATPAGSPYWPPAPGRCASTRCRCSRGTPSRTGRTDCASTWPRRSRP